MNLEVMLGSFPVSKLPKEVRPMMATLISEPFSDPDYLFEVKWDGYRAIAEIDNGVTRVYSRNNINFNEKFPAIVNSLKGYKKDAVFDGEIVVVDDRGRSSFQLLQDFQLGGGGILIYYIFDLLYFDGHYLMEAPLVDRKKILNEVMPEVPNIKFSDHIEKEGDAFFEAAKAENLEGIIAKNKNSLYRPGKRGSDWLKIKILLEQEAIICGFTAPRGSRKGFGSLILGVYESSELVYIGHSGGGFSEKEIEFMMKKMSTLIRENPPFKQVPKTNEPATWLEPKLVCEVRFQEWTREGHMRQPVFLGLREDKLPSEVRREKPGE